MLGKPAAPGVRLTAVGLGDDGLVVVGETADVVAGILRRSEPDPGLAPMRRMIEAPRGALRAVRSHVKLRSDEAPCVRRVAGGELFEPGNPDEDLVLELRGEPRAGDVALGTSATRGEYLWRSYRVSDVSRDGQLLRLKVRTPADAIDEHNAETIAQSGSDLDLVYRCPGAAAAKRAPRRRPGATSCPTRRLRTVPGAGSRPPSRRTSQRARERGRRRSGSAVRSSRSRRG